jgi:hypothetical protein
MSEVTARKDKAQHIGAEVNLITNDFRVQILDEESGADHSDFTVMQRRHLVAEVRQVS